VASDVPEAATAVNDYLVTRLTGSPNAEGQRCSSSASCPSRGSRSLPTPASTVPDRGRRRPAGRGTGLPPVLWLPAALALAFLVLPLLALLVRTPWSTVPELLLTAEVGQALRLSLACATSATLVCLVLGVPLAWVLARAQFPGRSLVRALVTVPLVLPPVVGGVALLLLLGRRGVLGQHLDRWFGISLPFTTPGRRHRGGVRRPAVPRRRRRGCAARGPTAATRTRRRRSARRG
jgi:molybdate transport system permease protein